MALRLSPKKRAFTIIELVVVALIFSGIMVMTSLLYFRGRDAMEQSTEKIDTTGRSRRAIDKITPLVASAVTIAGFEALRVDDTTPEILEDACHFDVTSRENFLASDYTPTQEFDAEGLYYRFRVAYEPEEQELRLYQLRIVPESVDEDVAPRILARQVQGCRFEALSPGSVRVTIEVRAKDEDQRRPGGFTKTQLVAILVAPGRY